MDTTHETTRGVEQVAVDAAVASGVAANVEDFMVHYLLST